MRIYDWHIAPNPRRLHVYLAEKGIRVELVEVGQADMTLAPWYKERYPHAMVPMLELDDGTCIGEAIALLRGDAARAVPDGHRRQGQGDRRDVGVAGERGGEAPGLGAVPQYPPCLRRPRPARLGRADPADIPAPDPGAGAARAVLREVRPAARRERVRRRRAVDGRGRDRLVRGRFRAMVGRRHPGRMPEPAAVVRGGERAAECYGMIILRTAATPNG